MPSSDSLSGLMRWLAHEEWSVPFGGILGLHVGPACEEAGIKFDEIAEILGDHHFAVLWGCAFEDFLTRDCGPDDRNIIDDYLKRRGWKESVANRRYMEALRTSTMSLYEVSDIAVGKSFLARDLVRGGEPIRISERTATKTLATWDRIGARVVTVNGKTMIAGGVLPFTHEASEEVIRAFAASKRKIRRELRKLTKELDVAGTAGLGEAVANNVSLATSAPIFTNIWLDDVLPKALNPTLPTIVNRDGEEIIFCAARYPFASGTTGEAVRTRLRSVTAFREANETFWNWVEPELAQAERPGAPPATKPSTGAGHTYTVTMEDGATVLGAIELAGDALVLTTNSRERAQRGRALMTAVLSNLVRAPLTKIETVEQTMAARRTRSPAPSNEIPADLQTQIVRASLDKHYRESLDQPIGMLGDITPRAAAKTKRGREKLVAWLKFLENQTGRYRDRGDPVGSYDFGWMWIELGVADLRR